MILKQIKHVAGEPIPYHPRIARVLGSVRDAVFLTHLLIWHNVADSEGWVCKSQAEITEETGLSRWEQETARRNLRAHGILKEKYDGLPRRLYIRVEIEPLLNLLRQDGS